MKKQKFRINMDLTIINKLQNTINENQTTPNAWQSATETQCRGN